MLEKLLRDEAQKISNLYKISSDRAFEKLKNSLENNLKLKELVHQESNIKDVQRTSLFKDFVKSVRKEIYYQLRTYQQSGSKEVETHLSTRERQPHLEQFFKQIDPYLKNSHYILDVGGGLFPLTFDFDKHNQVKSYAWLDKDDKSYKKLLKFKKLENLEQLHLYPYKIGEENWHKYLPESVNEFDFVFLLKLIPVIYRQERELLDIILEIPAKRFLITGSKESMVKRVNIESRENKVLQNFIKESNKIIRKKIEIPNEFGYIVE